MDQRRWISEEEWFNNMREDPHVRLRLRSVTIFKIPKFLKDIKKEAYVPQRVSLGPFHHGSAELTAMDHYKGRALRTMKTWFNSTRFLNEDDLTFANEAKNAILRIEHEIRRHYEGNIYCDGNTLSMMLILDGCFILEVLKTLKDRIFQQDEINAPIFGENMAAASHTLKDILMLENQIPWIVLVELLQLENARVPPFEVMASVTCGLFHISEEDRVGVLRSEWLNRAFREAPHFLGFLHKVIVGRTSNQGNREHRISIERCIGRCLQMLQGQTQALNHDFESIPPAVELKNAGIKFRPYDGGISHINFDQDSSIMYLPLLSITYDTEVLFRNLIAFEMCRASELNYVSSYVNLMDDLIDSQKDVAFLRSMGIITNGLGSDKEVADLFNGLFKGVTVRMPDKFYDLKKKVTANYKNTIRVHVEELWRDHCSTPWKVIPWLAGLAILCLTLIQTIYAPKK